MRRITAVFVVMAVVAAFGIVGCSGGDGDGLPGDGDGSGIAVDDALVGTWQPYLATMDGVQIAPSQAFDWDEGVVNMQIQFVDDGTLEVTHYGETEIAGTQDGTWTAEDGTGTLTVGEDVIDITYSFDGRVLVVNFTENDSEIMVRWVPKTIVDGRADGLARGWLLSEVNVNGTLEPIADFFGLQTEFFGVVLHMQPTGTLDIFVIEDDGDVLDHSRGTWATQDELLVINLEDDGVTLRGVWAADNTSITFLDEGNTTQFELTPWAPEGNRDTSVVGQWMPVQVERDGQSVPVANFFGYDPADSYMLMDFWPDGTVISRELTSDDEVVSGQLGLWTTDGGDLRLILDFDLTMDYTVSNGTMTVDFVQEGSDVTITWNRISQ